MEVEPYSPACRKVLERGEHVMLGVSTGNSYFSQVTVAALLRWALDRFASVDLVYSDAHLDTMRVADGDSPAHAAAGARRSLKDMRRRLRRAVEQVTPAGAELRVRSISEYAALPGYEPVRQRLEAAFARDRKLTAACETHIDTWLASRERTDGRQEDRRQAALAYLKAELPLITSTPEIRGVSTSLFCYHIPMPIVNELRGLTDYWHPGQGHAVVRPEAHGT
ncbi:tRNA-dependent cyclodipeptide synthase [Streptomyces sp. URMC 126]|uniref:tRNA-dependent cyclodipeptide synthase n=1 Tax=Streptomyces sp. URMC 126 TaxID=3423401 RepID=UPI003F19BF6C